MKLTFDRRYDKWKFHKESRERCDKCMHGAPREYCCKHQCGSYDMCDSCTLPCRTSPKLCERSETNDSVV